MPVVVSWLSVKIKFELMNSNIIEMTNYIIDRTGFNGGVAIVLGSGLGDFADNLTDKTVVPYGDIPGYPQPTVEGHAGEFVFGDLSGIPALGAKGRFHFYEGHDFHTVTLPIQLFHKLGVNALIVTNAAGSTRRSMPPGSLMALTGHLDGTFRHGPEDPKIVTGDPFHSPQLLVLARSAFQKSAVDLAEGIYCWTMGPSYETPDEIKYFRKLGADAVGMSTVPELQAAAKFGLPVLGISCITNFASGITDQPLSHQEVIDTAEAVKEKFTRSIIELIINIGRELNL